MGSDFVYDVGGVARRTVDAVPGAIAVDPDWRIEFSAVSPSRPVTFSGEITAASGGLLVRGTLEAVASHTCIRCLDEWDEEISLTVAQLVLPEDTNEEDPDYTYAGSELDLEPILRDELLLSLPLSPVCRDGCERLVEGQVNDLNTASPSDEPQSSSPFAVLKDLLDQEQ